MKLNIFDAFGSLSFFLLKKLPFLSFAYAKQYRIVVEKTDIRTTLRGQKGSHASRNSTRFTGYFTRCVSTTKLLNLTEPLFYHL